MSRSIQLVVVLLIIIKKKRSEVIWERYNGILDLLGDVEIYMYSFIIITSIFSVEILAIKKKLCHSKKTNQLSIWHMMLHKE